MKTLSLAALLAVLSPAALRAQPQPAPSEAATFARFDLALKDAMARLETVTKCLATVDVLTSDLAKKEKELRAEFGGAVPESFAPLLAMKKGRIHKQEAACIKAYNVSGPGFDVAQAMLREVEPKSQPGFKERRLKLESQRDNLNALAVKFGGQAPPKTRKADPTGQYQPPQPPPQPQKQP